MEVMSLIATHAACLGPALSYGVECEATESRRNEGLQNCNCAVINPVNVSKHEAFPGKFVFLQFSEEGRYVDARRMGKKKVTFLSNVIELKNRRRRRKAMVAGGNGIRDWQIGELRTVIYSPLCCKQINLGSYLDHDSGAPYSLGGVNLPCPPSRQLGVVRQELKKHSMAKFSYFADRNTIENSCENLPDLGNRQRIHENLLSMSRGLCETSMEVGKALLFLFGSTVLFFSVGAGLPKLALAQQSTFTPPSPPSDVSQAQATTTEIGYVSIDKQDISKQAIERETSKTSVDSAEDAFNADPRSQPKDKEALLEEFVESNPSNINAHRTLLHLYMRKGEVQSAVGVLDKLVTLQPDNLEWKYLKAQAYDFSGDVKAAREAFEELSKLQPLSARILQGLAVCMQKTGENPSAIIEMLNNAVRKAIAEKKTKEARNLRMLLGQILTLQGNLGDALKQYKQMEKEDSKDFRPYLCQGLVYSILGKTEEAENYFRRYHELCPSNFPNRGYLDELMLKAKTEARKFQEHQRKERESESRGLRSNKPMKQPEPDNHEISGKQ
ncbi:hypothetical protein O6H91_04G009000 [Diphasiastrum complanatum]|uniref:Uncharacterized protein n=1 Tax=Diphasiastrum complanatum TaxID=34168 RepID=A0ACC2DUE6_DIPCM|nr:hypothetical protein O6H91_Y083600 [Diphasiastrum complanatum]KAJ7557770.1 hypothetical protein O6H91_04G009000 [Diphasiastrum complanatum]